MTQPLNSGAPQPVQGVTGGPGINQGTASIEPGTGALVFHPQPANVVQVRGSTPGAFQVYEYFNSNTSFSRVALNAQTNGPFQLEVETQPPTVIRQLEIRANGGIYIPSDVGLGTQPLLSPTTNLYIVSATTDNSSYAAIFRNSSATANLVVARSDGQIALGMNNEIRCGDVNNVAANAIAFFNAPGSTQLSVTGSIATTTPLVTLIQALAAYGLIINATTP